MSTQGGGWQHVCVCVCLSASHTPLESPTRSLGALWHWVSGQLLG